MSAPSPQDVLGAAGIDPRLSRFVEATDTGGVKRRWHLLDNEALLAERGVTPRGTVLCIHGNPTWSFLFRDLVAADLPYRIVAVDQLEMGFSDRSGVTRRLQDRVTDLSLLTDTLRLPGKIVTVGHDWGGVVSLGWAVDNRHDLAGMILTNTAIHQGLDERLPKALGLASNPLVLKPATSGTTAFLDTALGLARHPLDPAVRAAFRAPYRTRADRAGIETFVADIPFHDRHPSRATLDRIADQVADLDVPTLMLWGPRDIVFGDRYLDDLMRRIPHADVHRFENASHLVWEDEDLVRPIGVWLDDTIGTEPFRVTAASGHAEQIEHRPLAAALERLGADAGHADRPAVIEMTPAGGGEPRAISWSLLSRRVRELAAGLLASGVRPGDRVSLLITPGADLTCALYACLRAGAVAVVADAGLGVTGLTRAVVGSRPAMILGIEPALAAARAFSWPGRRVSATPLPTLDATALGVEASMADLVRTGRDALAADPQLLGEHPDPDADAAILFTSGSTGPAKGAVYTHRQMSAMFAAVGGRGFFSAEGGLVAGFAPFALLGPALGIPSVVPDMEVTAPATLTAANLADAVAQLDAPSVFTAPAALRNVIDTAGQLTDAQRDALATVPVFLSAGAPIPAPLLRRLKRVMPNATAYTPYGMTECLVATTIDLAGIEDAGDGNGVCVGAPADRVDIAINPLDADGRVTFDITQDAEITGEVLIRAPHVRDRYDKRWIQDRAAGRVTGYHSTGDVGHLDAAGRLWIEGRLSHVISTADGPVTPVAVESAAETVPGIRRAGAAGVGPRGTQQIVVVAERDRGERGPGGGAPRLAGQELLEKVREATGLGVVAVFEVPELPTDIRHNSKINRSRLAEWAGDVLGGGKLVAP